MAVLYLDTSALAKLYVQEDGSEMMLKLAHPDEGHELAILALVRIELRAAVRRRARLGDFRDEIAESILSQFDAQLGTLFLVQPVNDSLLEAACDVVDRFGLRAYDAVQLAGCLVLGRNIPQGEDLWFVTSDQDLEQPAIDAGLHVVNPLR